ncbi:MAG: glycogen-debranching protein [Myxococcales bacterium]|nr:glycogen-debranching protein [Myxococcales bacterium]
MWTAGTHVRRWSDSRDLNRGSYFDRRRVCPAPGRRSGTVKRRDTTKTPLLLAGLLAAACGVEPGPTAEPEQAPVSVPDSTSTTFRVYSAHATRIEVWLFAGAGDATPTARHAMTKGAGDVWQVRVNGVKAGALYGLRAWGPNWPYDASWAPGASAGFISHVDAAGNRFNPNKLLIDPYAKAITGDVVRVQDPVTGALRYDPSILGGNDEFAFIDSAAAMPKSVVVSDGFSWGGDERLGIPPEQSVAYEVHLRGFTRGDDSLPYALRGTYDGFAERADHLVDLGVTAVELLPVQETQNDANDVDPVSTTGDNYWGYMTLSYFAPDRRYAADQTPGGPTREFKAMVKAFHDAGIKVFIDVVYNHTGEGGVWGTDNRVMNVQSFRGLDNQRYYSLTSDRQYPYDNTGVGGNFNTYDPAGRAVIIDSLAYFAEHLGVDGFRFDLASVLGNTCTHGCFNFDKLDPNTALNQIAFRFPPRPATGGAGVDLIAEPWAIGGNSYQVGGFPAGWAEWNGIYRDTLRKDQNRMGIDAVTPGDLATRFAGSSDLYQDDGRKPYHSVNFMVAHDGFTLKDLYSCNSKDNLQPWPYGPSDGGEDHNNSWDQGGDPAEQRKAARNGMAFLMLSGGVPMITGGDEHLRTQYCNNNVYNLDSVANWLDYTLSPEQQNFHAFAQRMIEFRKAHPALRPAEFYSGNDTNGNVLEQLRWFTPAGVPPDGAYWGDANNHALAWRYDGTEFGDPASAIYVAYNGWSGMVNFTLPWPGPNKSWFRVTDTCNWAEGPDQVVQPGQEAFIGGEYTNYGVCGRGLIILIAK